MRSIIYQKSSEKALALLLNENKTQLIVRNENGEVIINFDYKELEQVCTDLENFRRELKRAGKEASND